MCGKMNVSVGLCKRYGLLHFGVPQIVYKYYRGDRAFKAVLIARDHAKFECDICEKGEGTLLLCSSKKKNVGQML